MRTIAVTGGSGKLGGYLIRALQEAGYEVISLDMKRTEQLHSKQLTVDLNDFGQVAAALHGADAVMHMGAIPAPLGYPHHTIFANNVLSSYHIMEAASLLGIRRVILGSSESSYGFAWAPRRFSPNYLPIDEQHPQQPQECYGLSKVVNELTASMFHRRNGLEVVGLRFSMITRPQEYEHLQLDNPNQYKHIMWSYIDIRDAVSACIASLHADIQDAVFLNITADDTYCSWETQELIQHCYPEVTDLRAAFDGRQAVVSNQKAKQRLGWRPLHSWTDGK